MAADSSDTPWSSGQSNLWHREEWGQSGSGSAHRQVLLTLSQQFAEEKEVLELQCTSLRKDSQMYKKRIEAVLQQMEEVASERDQVIKYPSLLFTARWADSASLCVLLCDCPMSPCTGSPDPGAVPHAVLQEPGGERRLPQADPGAGREM